MIPELFESASEITARAYFTGERLRTRTPRPIERLGSSPLAVRAGRSGCAVFFRFGAFVLFGLDEAEAEELVRESRILDGQREALDEALMEEVDLKLKPGLEEGVDITGAIVLSAWAVEKLQAVAYILAKSVALEHYEKTVALVTGRIEPLARRMHEEGAGWFSEKTLVRHIGESLLIQNRMAGRVEVVERPDLLWDRPDLERLYIHLEAEFELKERHSLLGRKLDLVQHTAQTLLDLMMNKRSLRVEWYIVVLIVAEIALSLYDLFIKR